MFKNVFSAFLFLLFVFVVYEWGRLSGFVESSAICEVLFP